jgi:hypothetical protein
MELYDRTLATSLQAVLLRYSDEKVANRNGAAQVEG